MMEQQTLSRDQRNVEMDALYPPEEKPVRPTSEVIIIGEDSAQAERYVDADYDANVATNLNLELKELDGDLVLKITNELITQVFRDDFDESLVNIEAVKQVLEVELQSQKDHYFQMALHIENKLLPEARMRSEPIFGDADAYVIKDIPALDVRSATNTEMAVHIQAIQDTGEDSLRDLAEIYIERCLADARDKAIAILIDQKKALEKQKAAREEKIAELEGTIGALRTALEEAEADVVARDMDMYDQELIAHMTQGARALAR